MTERIGRRWTHGVHRPQDGDVAWIEVFGDAVSDSSAPGAALDRIGSVVRVDDQVCPVGGSIVAVRLGSISAAVPLDVLGQRLAACLAPRRGADRSAAGLSVAVGLAAATGGDQRQVASRARGAARSAAHKLRPDGPDGAAVTAAIAVDETVADHPFSIGPELASLPLRRRSVFAGTLRPPNAVSGVRSARDFAVPSPDGDTRCVLVLNPMAGDHGSVGFSAEAAVALADRLGLRAGTTVVTPADPPVTTVGGCDVDLVILVLDGAWVGRSTTWSNGAWGRPARMAAIYADKGIPVIAVSAGAGAGALAACVTSGAVPVFSFDRLGAAIRSLDGVAIDDARLTAALEAPERFRALLGLTAGERRVLFHLTEGWAAQDIAEELVVSLTTVRSHIRSILRKLEVRSQLAAVAIANSRDLEHHRVIALS